MGWVDLHTGREDTVFVNIDPSGGLVSEEESGTLLLLFTAEITTDRSDARPVTHTGRDEEVSGTTVCYGTTPCEERSGARTGSVAFLVVAALVFPHTHSSVQSLHCWVLANESSCHTLQVPEIRDKMLSQNEGHWANIAKKQYKNFFNPSVADMKIQAER